MDKNLFFTNFDLTKKRPYGYQFELFFRLPKTINEDLIVAIVMVVAAIGIATEAVVAIVIVIKNAVDAKNKKKLPLQCSIYFLSMIPGTLNLHTIQTILMTHNL